MFLLERTSHICLRLRLFFHPSNFSITVFFLVLVGLSCQQFIFYYFMFKKKKDKCSIATIQYTVISARFLAKHTFISVTEAISLGPENKGHVLNKSLACFLNPAVGYFQRNCKQWTTTAKKERKNIFNTSSKFLLAQKAHL